MDYPKFKVHVICNTYNQAGYINDALDGFVMQNTDFPFICSIVDDASTDGEQDVIRRYVEANFDLSKDSCHFNRETDYAYITYAQHKSNKNCFFAVLFLRENHYSIRKNKYSYLSEWRDLCEYEAPCEGDDFWVDPNKLQIQVDILDAHGDYMMVCSDGNIMTESKGIPLHANYTENCVISPADMIENGGLWILTCTMLYRRVVSEKKQNIECTRQCHVGDYCLQILSVVLGKAYFLSRITGVYRFMSIGSWTSRQRITSLEKKLPGVISEIKMLEGLDAYSNYQYHLSFEKRLSFYINSQVLYVSPNSVSIFKETFNQYWSYFSKKNKIIFYLSGNHITYLMLRVCKSILHFIKKY